MKPKDTVQYLSKLGEKYKGIITWIDDKKGEAGVVILEPKVARGAAEVIIIKEAKPELLAEFEPETFRRDLTKLSTQELRDEIEELRASRLASRRKRMQPKAKVSSKEKLLIRKLKSLSPEVLKELLGDQKE